MFQDGLFGLMEYPWIVQQRFYLEWSVTMAWRVLNGDELTSPDASMKGVMRRPV